MTGGDSFSFTDLPKGAANPVWSPDGKWIAFNSDANPEDLAKQEKKKEEKAASQTSPSHSTKSSRVSAEKKPHDDAAKKADSDHESDVRVITRAVYREDNEGYADPKHPTHIWLIQAPHSADEKPKPKQLTTGRFDEGNIVWSKDGSKIYFISSHVDEPYYEEAKSELYSISPNGGEATKLSTIDLDVGQMSLSPDGNQVAFVASATRTHRHSLHPARSVDCRSYAKREGAKPDREIRF